MNWTTNGAEPAIARSYRPIDSAVLNVLSASMYDDGMSSASTRKNNPQRARGFVKEIASGDDDDEEEELSRPRKRARTTKSSAANSGEGSDDGNRKHRGRPRIEAQDETATDRRRTQIRLAQRAYRSRKETTIATLKQQNAELQESIIRLNNTFSELYDNLLLSNIMAGVPTALQDLETLRKELDHATNLTYADEQSENDQASTAIRSKRRQSPNEATREKPDKKAVASKPNLKHSAPQAEFTPEQSFARKNNLTTSDSNPISTLNSSLTGSRSVLAATSYFDWNSDSIRGLEVPRLDSTAATSLSQNWLVDGMSLEKAFPQRKAYTYSFQETTFARRLHRMCLEHGFRSLINPESDPSFVARVFRFSLLYSSKDNLRDNLGLLLQRRAGEPLENWAKPYFHVGGAGTHFPERDEFGKPVFPPNLQSPAIAPGPWKLLDSRSGNIRAEVVQAMLEEMGFNGDWFDSHDVEEYLKSKGIHLDGSSSYIELDTTKFSLGYRFNTTSTTSSSVSTLATSPSSLHSVANDPTQLAVMGMDEATMLSGQIGDSSLNYLDAIDGNFASPYEWSMTNMEPNGVEAPSPGTTPTFEQIMRRKQGVITFDVDRFLERMLETGSSCLGRAPGFRKDAIDSALALAVQEAF